VHARVLDSIEAVESCNGLDPDTRKAIVKNLRDYLRLIRDEEIRRVRKGRRGRPMDYSVDIAVAIVASLVFTFGATELSEALVRAAVGDEPSDKYIKKISDAYRNWRDTHPSHIGFGVELGIEACELAAIRYEKTTGMKRMNERDALRRVLASRRPAPSSADDAVAMLSAWRTVNK
jgi:hypothetical protein